MHNFRFPILLQILIFVIIIKRQVMNNIKILELEKDIEEINRLLNKETFNRTEAISIIEKHKIKDAKQLIMEEREILKKTI